MTGCIFDKSTNQRNSITKFYMTNEMLVESSCLTGIKMRC